MLEKSPGIRIGVVGAGYWGSRHLRVLRSTTGVSSVIVIDPRFAESDGGGRRCRPDDGDVVAYADLDDALPEVDAVVIATPPSSHASLGLRAIAAGKHVLIEKPLATTALAARCLVDAASSANVLLMSGHTFEYNAAVHKLRDVVRGDELGRLYYMDCARLNLGLYQTDVNVLVDLAPHDISIANFVLGSRPTTISAWGSCHLIPDLADDAYLRLDYADSGVRVNIHVSWLYPNKVRRVTAVGSSRMAVYDDVADEERIRIYHKSAVPPQKGDGPLSRVAYQFGDIVSPLIPFAEPLAVQDQDFIDRIASGVGAATDASSSTGLTVVQVLECAQISLREQRPVALAEVTEQQTAAQFAASLTDGMPAHGKGGRAGQEASKTR